MSKLRAMNGHDLRVLVDLVDHTELTASSRTEPIKLAPERLPCPVWVLGDRPEDRFDDFSANLGRQPVDMPEALRRDLDLVNDLEVVLEPESPSLGCLAPGCADGLEERLVQVS